MATYLGIQVKLRHSMVECRPQPMPRPPSRALRRDALGHRQYARWVERPRDPIIFGGSIVMHPDTWAALTHVTLPEGVVP